MYLRHSLSAVATAIAAIAVVVTSPNCWSIDWQDGLERRGMDGEFTAPYRLYLPPGHDDHAVAEKEFPLVIYLHGASRRGTDNIRQVIGRPIVQSLIDKTQDPIAPAFLLVPHVPAKTDWVFEGHANEMHNALIDMIVDTVDEYPIDPHRVYLTGYSMGSFGTYSMIYTDPRLFAAAMPVAGGWRKQFVKPFVHVPLWGFHGRNDTVNPINGIPDLYDGHPAIIEALREAGGTPRFTVTDDAHDVARIYHDGEFDYYSWLTEQRNHDVRIAGVTLVGGWKSIGKQRITAHGIAASPTATDRPPEPQQLVTGSRLANLDVRSNREFAEGFCHRDDLLHLELDGTLDSSDLLIGNELDIDGGRLKIWLLNGTLQPGDRFQLLKFNEIEGSFSTVELPPLPEGQAWNTEDLYSDGIISVVPD